MISTVQMLQLWLRYYYGVYLIAGDGFNAAVAVNNGNLTAGGSTVGIYYRWSYDTTGPSSLTVSGNAVVNAEGSIAGIKNNASDNFHVGADGESGGHRL